MAAQVTGRVHSVESFGTVDGPGVRFVVFLQGCPMRCLYCHNPDTWDPGGGVPTTVEELLAQYARNEAFYRKGGITVTGGEPLLQIEFVTALFREAKRRGIHTCLDTSGATFRPVSYTHLNFILPDICKPCLFVFLRNLFYLTYRRAVRSCIDLFQSGCETTWQNRIVYDEIPRFRIFDSWPGAFFILSLY